MFVYLQLFARLEIERVVDLDNVLVEIERGRANPDEAERTQAHDALREPLEFARMHLGLDDAILDELANLVLAHAAVEEEQTRRFRLKPARLRVRRRRIRLVVVMVVETRVVEPEQLGRVEKLGQLVRRDVARACQVTHVEYFVD